MAEVVSAVAYRLVGIVIALTFIALSTSGASAKLPSYIITGGELGEYAAHVDPTTLREEDPFSMLLQGQDSHAIVTPKQAPGLMYEVWQPFGYLDLVLVLEYYPKSGLIRMERSGGWYQAGPSIAAFLDDALNGALQKKEAGELEQGVRRAQLRAIRLPEASFLLRRFAVPGEGYNFVGSGECAGCTFLLGPNEAFVMGDLAEVMEGPLVGPAADMPPYAIEYEIPNPPDGFIRQLLGMYRPPENDAPGQFWFRQYSRATLYRETTPGFDAVIAEALARSEPWGNVPDDGVVLESESGGRLSTRLLISGLAGGAVVFLAGSAILYRRRTA